ARAAPPRSRRGSRADAAGDRVARPGPGLPAWQAGPWVEPPDSVPDAGDEPPRDLMACEPPSPSRISSKPMTSCADSMVLDRAAERAGDGPAQDGGGVAAWDRSTCCAPSLV